MAATKFVWYPCSHSKSSGKFYEPRALNETGTLVHEEGNIKTPFRGCSQCYSLTHWIEGVSAPTD